MDLKEPCLDRFCRVCMASLEDCTSDIYSQSMSPDRPSIRSMLGIICPAVFPEVYNYPEDSRMPHRVCATCEHAIVDSYRLHQTCVETDRKFREQLPTVKQEPLENSYFESVTIDPVVDFELAEVKIEEPEIDESMSDSGEVDCKSGKRSKSVRIASKKKPLAGFKRTDRKNQKRVHAPCELCSEKFNSYVRLRRHIEQNHPNQAYGCEMCKKIFVSKEQYEEHRKNHFNIAKKPSVEPKRKLQTRVHASCEYCSEKFDSHVRLKKHLGQSHPEHVYGCELCEKIYLTEEQYEEHRQFHITGKRFGCQICGKRFKHRKGLDGHLNEHTNSESSPCPECGKTFRDAQSLRLHVLRHSKQITLYPCEQCPVKLSSMAKMKAHMLTHTKERNHVCETCGSRFTVVFSLQSHMKNVHGERNFTCETCNLKFSCAKNLNRHMRTHTGEKPYVCPYCDRAYAQSNDLIKHSRIHVGEKPYSCDRCSECFRFATELRNHYRVHFSAAEKAEADATGAMFGGIANKAIFSITEILKRRFEAEQQQKLLSN